MRNISSGAGPRRKGGKLLDRRLLTKSPRSRSTNRRVHALAVMAWFLLVAVLPGSSGCSRGSQAQVALIRRAAPPDGFCGSSDDGLAHVPPRFNEFVPP